MNLKATSFKWMIPLAVIAAFQVPKAVHAYNQGSKAGNAFCTKVTNGDSPNRALRAVISEMSHEKFSKTYEGIAEMGMKNKVENCPAVETAVANRIWK